MHLYCCSEQFGRYADRADRTTSNTVLFDYVINGNTQNLSMVTWWWQVWDWNPEFCPPSPYNNSVGTDDSGILCPVLPLLRCWCANRAVYEAQQFVASCCTHKWTQDTPAHSELSESSELFWSSALRGKKSSFSPNDITPALFRANIFRLSLVPGIPKNLVCYLVTRCDCSKKERGWWYF